MSIALDRSNAALISPRPPAFGSPPLKIDDGADDGDSCSSSSIGKNSDDEDAEGEEASVQSKFNDGDDGGGAFNSLQALEQILPMRTGISSFYIGKSKSYVSLSSCVSSSSIKEIAKPENAHTRKRRNLMANSSHLWDRNHHRGARGICKKSSSISMRTSRSSLALAVAVAMSRSGSSDSNGSSSLDTSHDFGSHSSLTRSHPD